MPYDWSGFFTQRVYTLQPRAPLGGLEAAGWKLVYTDRPSVFHKLDAVIGFLILAGIAWFVWDHLRQRRA